MKKPGTPAQRVTAASIARKARAMWRGLQGGWSRKEWNAQARIAVRGYLKRCATQQRTADAIKSPRNVGVVAEVTPQVSRAVDQASIESAIEPGKPDYFDRAQEERELERA